MKDQRPVSASAQNDPDGFIFRGRQIVAQREEEAAELEARELIEHLGFAYNPCHNPESLYAGLRFCYRLPGVWSPLSGGVPVGWGFTPVQAAMNMLAEAPKGRELLFLLFTVERNLATRREA